MLMRRLLLPMLLVAALASDGYCSDTLTYNVRRTNDWAFYGTDNPTAEVVLYNSRKIPVPFDFSCDVMDFKGRGLYQLQQRGTVVATDSSQISFSFKTVEPGFYNMRMYNGGRYLSNMNVAYEPEKIGDNGSVDGEKEDFGYLAVTVSVERRDLKPQFVMLRNKSLSGKEKNVYDFSMVSRGEEKVSGYVAFPRGKKGIPMMVSLVPVEDRGTNPLADFTASANSAELVVYLKQRGKGDEMLKNILTDVVLAIDFVAQRQEIDKSAIYVQGWGYAAACAFVASSMTDNVCASFASSPDFTLFTEKYNIGSIVNKVSAPVLLGMGLQEDVLRLQETFSIYNSVKGIKEYFINAGGDCVDRNRWKYVRDIFILRLSK